MTIEKRVFFAMEAEAPWPEKLPTGRLLDPTHRHMTLAFLGSVDIQKLFDALKHFPMPPFKVGFAGKFDEVLFLPPRHPHVVAWHVQWLENALPLLTYQKALTTWLQTVGFHPDVRDEYLPHVTICRSPFKTREWEKAFHPIPVILTHLHLYESLGGLKYAPIWTHHLARPFQEIEHTADVAFIIRGESLEQIYSHALSALSFSHSDFSEFMKPTLLIESIEDVIVALNSALAFLDQRGGCPFKAVSYHGEIEEQNDGILQWEMIVDV